MIRNLFFLTFLLGAECFFFGFNQPESHQGCKKPYIINVEGIVGTGKSTFLRFFGDYPGVEVLPEPVHKWTNLNGTDLLQLIFDDPQRWALAQESYVQLTMFQETIGRKPGMIAKVMERSIHSARYVFIENLREAKCMSQVEYVLLDKWYKMLNTIPDIDVSPNMIVYLQSSPDVVFDRIQKRGRPEEAHLTKSFLNRIHRLHEDWLVHRNTSFPLPTENIHVVNTSRSYEEMVQIYKVLAKKIWRDIRNKQNLI